MAAQHNAGGRSTLINMMTCCVKRRVEAGCLVAAGQPDDTTRMSGLWPCIARSLALCCERVWSRMSLTSDKDQRNWFVDLETLAIDALAPARQARKLWREPLWAIDQRDDLILAQPKIGVVVAGTSQRLDVASPALVDAIWGCSPQRWCTCG